MGSSPIFPSNQYQTIMETSEVLPTYLGAIIVTSPLWIGAILVIGMLLNSIFGFTASGETEINHDRRTTADIENEEEFERIREEKINYLKRNN